MRTKSSVWQLWLYFGDGRWDVWVVENDSCRNQYILDIVSNSFGYIHSYLYKQINDTSACHMIYQRRHKNIRAPWKIHAKMEYKVVYQQPSAQTQNRRHSWVVSPTENDFHFHVSVVWSPCTDLWRHHTIFATKNTSWLDQDLQSALALKNDLRLTHLASWKWLF